MFFIHFISYYSSSHVCMFTEQKMNEIEKKIMRKKQQKERKINIFECQQTTQIFLFSRASQSESLMPFFHSLLLLTLFLFLLLLLHPQVVNFQILFVYACMCSEAGTFILSFPIFMVNFRRLHLYVHSHIYIRLFSSPFYCCLVCIEIIT